MFALINKRWPAEASDLALARAGPLENSSRRVPLEYPAHIASASVVLRWTDDTLSTKGNYGAEERRMVTASGQTN